MGVYDRCIMGMLNLSLKYHSRKIQIIFMALMSHNTKHAITVSEDQPKVLIPTLLYT